MRRAAQRLTQTVCVAIASCLYLTFIPAALVKNPRFTGAGFIGTACGIAGISALPIDIARQIAVWAGAVAIAVVISDIAEQALGRHDDPRIVIDEFVGVWTALLFLPRSWPALVLAFILFRIFDVLKPGLVRRSGDLPGGWGIVMDDVLAGAAANVLLQAINHVHPL